MAILINRDTRVLIQGITGTEGARACKYMREYGTQVVAGVTPGKGGQEVEGVPVYNTVREALEKHPEVNTSLITVPAAAVKDAALEAISAGIPLIDILTDFVLAQDSATIIAWARKKGVRVIGPGSIGIISPQEKVKVGSIGTGDMVKIFKPGPVGLVSKSGGMTGELAYQLTAAGIGQSTALGIGGDALIGSDFVDILELFEQDPKTKLCVLFGEVGGTYEERVAAAVAAGLLKKPIVIFIAGRFTSSLPQGTVLGHAGAIVSPGMGGYDSKVAALRKAGVHVAESLEEVPRIVARLLAKMKK
jgi:succinyl-CoA synthetase alpha subunit